MKSFAVFLESAHKRCELNIVSCSMIYHYLLENGHIITQNAKTADYIIINSCGYHQDLREASLALYKTYHKMKKQTATIIMFGCLVKIDETLVHSLDTVAISFTDSHVMDTIFLKKKKITQMVPCCDDTTRNVLFDTKQYTQDLKNPNFLLSKLFLPFSQKMKENYNKMTFESGQENKILVQISQGCLGDCAYCVIKKAKGTLQSRSINAILKDITRMYNPSKTLYLVADDCSSYGLDIGTNLFELLKKIQKKYPTMPIHISYISPHFLVKYQKECKELFQKVCIPYTTIPLQSGSNKIINKMNRNYDVSQVVRCLKELKQISPHTTFEGHFIVGYPGETIVDFLKSVVTTRHFDYPVALIYSESKGTKSATLPAKKSQIIKYLRRALMIVFINTVIIRKLAKNPINKQKSGPEEI